MIRPLLLALLLATPAFSQSAEPLRIELNRLEPREGSCRVWLVLNNANTEALNPLRLDLVLFGRDGVVARRLAVDVGPLAAGRTQARIFDLTSQGCESISQVLLNDILACNGTDEAVRNACTDRAVLTSRVDGVTFQK